MNKAFILFFSLPVLVLMSACQKATDHQEEAALFVLRSAKETGIDFENNLEYDRDFNIYTYRNFYNGGGVAIGDINNDGLADIYFSANMAQNRLFLNKGNFQFEDITEKAGVGGRHFWSTGVAMADLNADGWLDIYVCNSGDVDKDNRQNELFLNNGNLTFSEKAEVFGLANQGLSTHAAFFDYDKDGDLDAYLLNNSFRAIGSFNLQENERHIRDPEGGDKLYQNQDGKFVDVSEEAGIFGSVIGFGLGVMVSDLDQDNWPDIYVCNDFFERDYLYMNNRDGTFREALTRQMRSTSMASMGVDIADLNNDGYPEIFVTEMLPKDESRLKSSMTFENWNKYKFNLQHDYYHQLTRNMLQVNNGPAGAGDLSFSELGRLSGVEATDWSWSALMADLDQDGNKDLYVTNGIYQDILNQDYLQYISSDVAIKSIVSGDGVDYKKLIDMIPSQPLSNVAFSGNDQMLFTDMTRQWGLYHPGYSNGLAYGDLDNDGDLDLVVNNVNMPAFIYENRREQIHPENHFLKVKLLGSGKNTQAIGAKVMISQKGRKQTLEQMPFRGFQSSVDYTLVFGLPSADRIDTLRVIWADGKQTQLNGVNPDQLLSISYEQAEDGPDSSVEIHDGPPVPVRWKNITSLLPEDLAHEENKFSDFDKDQLLFHMLSTAGPKMAIGDIDQNGLEDIYLCGAKGMPGKIFLQFPDGRLRREYYDFLKEDKRCEDVDAVFFDADADGDLDLYVVSGGNELPSVSSGLVDRLYFNKGKGQWARSEQLLPTNQFESTSCIEPFDFDGDGDTDLFVGVRLKDRMIGIPQNGYLLQNNGQGHFTECTGKLAPELKELGSITDAIWVDLNGDDKVDLVVVGEWMDVEVFINSGGQFRKATDRMGLKGFSGWWNTITANDLDNDGDLDLIVGNHGLNSRFRASPEKPVSCYINDFDGNGQIEQIMCAYNGEASYPIPLRHDLIKQLPYLKKKYLKYESYKLQGMADIFTDEQLQQSIILKATTLENMVLLNERGSTFKMIALPLAAQVSPVYAIHTDDFNQDGITDLLLAGNLFEVKPEVGRYDASYGVCLIGKGDGTFQHLKNADSNLDIFGQVRDIKVLEIGSQKTLLLATNNNKVQAIQP